MQNVQPKKQKQTNIMTKLTKCLNGTVHIECHSHWNHNHRKTHLMFVKVSVGSCELRRNRLLFNYTFAPQHFVISKKKELFPGNEHHVTREHIYIHTYIQYICKEFWSPASTKGKVVCNLTHLLENRNLPCSRWVTKPDMVSLSSNIKKSKKQLLKIQFKCQMQKKEEKNAPYTAFVYIISFKSSS